LVNNILFNINKKTQEEETDIINSSLRKITLSIFISLLIGLQYLAVPLLADSPFGPNTRVSDITIIEDNEGKIWPAIATDNEGSIYVVWADDRDMLRDIYLSKSTDGGSTFSENRKISDSITESICNRPAIAIDDSNNIYVAWIDTRNSNYDVYSTFSTDGGITFSENKKVNDVDIKVGYGTPAIAAYGSGNIVIAWEDNRDDPNGDIYFANSTNGGNTFSPNKKINDDAGTNTQEDPSIAINENNTIYIAWSDDRDVDYDIYLSNSTNGGNSFSPNQRINDGALDAWHREPSISVDDMGTIYVASTRSESGDSNISFSFSTDGGNTFSPNITVSDASSGIQNHPSLTLSEYGNIYIAWEDSRNINDDIYFTNSTNGGLSFSPNLRINDDVGTSAQWKPCITSYSEANVFAVWEDNRNGEWEIYFSNSSDGGDTFSPDIMVNDNIRNAWRLTSSIAVDNEGNIFVLWSDDRGDDWDIYFANSTDFGQTFSPDKRINDDSSGELHWDPRIAVDSKGDIYCVWEDNRDGIGPDIYFSKSTDGGNTFSPNIKINDNIDSSAQMQPSIAIDDSDNIYVVWEDGRDFDSNIYLANSTDGGLSFSANKKITNFIPFIFRQSPSIAAAGNGSLHIAWCDDRNSNYDIFYSNSTDGGNTFSSEQKINDDIISEDQFRPSIAVDDAGNIFIAWKDRRNGDYDIYSANSTDGGINFSPNTKVNDDIGTNEQSQVAIAAGDPQNVYLVWLDFRNNERDIYFSQSFDGGNTFIPNTKVNEDITPTYQDTPSIALDNASNVYVAWSDKIEGVLHTYFSTNLFNTYNIQIFNITDVSAEITWKTNIPANGTVEYGFTTNYDIAIIDNTEVMDHHMVLSGLAPGRLYHFRVSSYNGSDKSIISHDLTFTTKFPIYLEPGWNMISVPLNQTDFNIAKVFETIEGDYDAVQWYDVTDPSDHWKHNHILKSPLLNDLKEVNRSMGLWIHVTNPLGTTLYVDGIAPEIGYVNQVILNPGWNLVGYPSLIERIPPFNLPPEVDMVQWYNATSGLWESWDPGSLSPDNLPSMRPGQGFWIHTTGPTSPWLLEYVN
jgi:hypothetical protein